MLIIGALLGFISVAFGAYAEHGLQEMLTQDQFRHILTAVRYNEIYGILISVFGLMFLLDAKLRNSKMLCLAGYLFILGVAMFSFSIYLAYTFNIPNLIAITPYGGMTIMLAWLVLLVAGVVSCRHAPASRNK